MSASPFTLPLTAAQFAAALQNGQGRALMHVCASGAAGIEDVIIDACLRDLAYDPQCEGDRSGWLMDIVDASGASDRIARALMPRLDEPTDEFWDATQRCRIAFELAKRGRPEARTRLYACLRKWPDFTSVLGAEGDLSRSTAPAASCMSPSTWGGCSSMSEGSGLMTRRCTDSTRSTARARGGASWMQPRRGAAEVAAYLRHLDEREASRRADNASLEASGSTRHAEKMQRITAADAIRRMETGGPHQSPYWFTEWGRRAREEGLCIIFEFMLTRPDPAVLCACLRVFSRRALSAFDARMLRYADHALPEVRTLAHKALSNYTHPEVRRLGIERLGAGQALEGELLLLKKNYEPGDAGVIERVLRVPQDRHQLHGLGFELVELFRANQVAESSQGHALCVRRVAVLELPVRRGNNPGSSRHGAGMDAGGVPARFVRRDPHPLVGPRAI